MTLHLAQRTERGWKCMSNLCVTDAGINSIDPNRIIVLLIIAFQWHSFKKSLVVMAEGGKLFEGLTFLYYYLV